MLCIGLNEARSQGFYTLIHQIDSLYPSDTAEDGPKAYARRNLELWKGQFNAQGSFSTAAGNYKAFATALPNFRATTTNCSGDFVPTWKEIGPTMKNDNTNSVWGAGQMHDLVFHPGYDGVNNTTLFATSYYGGLWKSYDNGESWTRLKTDHDIAFSSLGVLVIDPSNPQRMYITTGNSMVSRPLSSFHPQDDYPGYTLGIYATDDGGDTWQQVNTGISSALFSNGGTIYNMAMDPLDNDHLIFTSTNGVYYCTNASGSLGSISWTKSTQFNTVSGSENVLPGLTYNPTSNVWYISGKKVYSSSTPFSGTGWTNTTGSGSGMDLSSGNFPSTSLPVQRINVVNCLSSLHDDDIYAFIHYGTLDMALAKKTGSGAWSILQQFSAASAYGRSERTAIVPNHGNQDVYIGNNEYFFYDGSTTSISRDYPNNKQLHADVNFLTIHPSQPNILWYLSDGGISKKDLTSGSFNQNATFKNNGIQSHLLWDFDDSEMDRDYMLAALQDNGTMYTGGAALSEWKTAFFGGDGYNSDILDSDPSDAVTGNSNGMRTFDYTTGLSPAFLSTQFGDARKSNYFSNPQYPNEKIWTGGFHLYHKNSGVWESSNRYSPNNVTLSFNGQTYNIAGSGADCRGILYKTTHQNYFGTNAPAYALNRYQFSPSAGCNNSVPPTFITKSNNGYNHFINGSSVWENYFNDISTPTNGLYDDALTAGAISSTDVPLVTGISCKPEDGNKVWVSSPGLLPNFKIWKSVDGGANWTNAVSNGAFNNIPVFDILVIEGSKDLVFAGTMDGVYYTDNTMNGTWCRYGDSPSIQALSLKYNPCKNKLIVSTYGRGAFEVDLPFQPVASFDVLTTQTWSSPAHFPNTSVTVKSGAALTIQNTSVYFGPNSRIYVEAGAKLVINNATLTNESGCNGYMWKGIELQGNIAQKQVLSGGFYPNHGWCVMSNNATVKNAEIGVKNFASVNGDGWTIDWSTMGGGIIQSTNGKFLNCGEGAKFISYINKNGLNQPTNDKSFFTTTQFLTDATSAITNYLPGTHLAMWGTRGIGITSNTFKNVTPGSYAISKRGNGIVAWDATFTTGTPCITFNSTTGQCSTYGTRNTFENLFYGVDAGASVATIIDNVSVCTFTNNHRGIIFRGTTQSTAYKNNIAIGDAYVEPTGVGTAMATYFPYGIYLDVCDAYNVSENVFTDASGTNPDTDYGIIVSNTGVNTNVLRKNTFSNTAFGIQAQEENYDLQLKCNKFTASTIKNADVNIMGLAMQGSIAQQQGLCSQDATDLPGNEFSHTCTYAQDLGTNSNVLYQVAYNTRASVPVEVPQAGCYNTTDYAVNFCSNPPTGEVCPPPTGGGIGGMRMAQSNADKELSDMGQLIAAKQQLLDDGNTAQLYTDISSATDENTLKQTLMQKGPYLSDQVLLEFINHTPAWSANTVKDVLINNSPLQPAVLAAVNGLNLASKVKSQIAAFQSGMSQRTSLEKEIRYLKTSRVLLYNTIINAVLNDTLNPSVYDTLYTKLNFTISPQSRYIYISALMDQGNYTQAQAELSTLRQSGEKAENCDYLDALITLKQQQNGMQAYKSNAAISSKIDLLLNQWPLGRSVNANVLHSSLFGTRYQEQVYIEETLAAQERLSLEKEEATPLLENNFQVLTFPNPASNEIAFVVNGQSEDDHCNIMIYDVNGKLMSNFSITENKTPKTILLNDYSSGVYFYKAVSGNKVIQNKLVIIK